MKLTIGMAAYDDLHGVVFTVQALRLSGELSPDDEIIVVDNNPNSPHGRATRRFVGSCGDKQVKYLPYAENVGTTQSREMVFRAAGGDAVLCCDCHVLFPPGAIARLKVWYEEHNEPHLYHGPLALTNLHNWHTHFNNYWRNWMWGTWGTAWHCRTCGQHFTTMKRNDQVSYWDLATSSTELAACKCRNLPPLAWAGQERKLIEAGCAPLGFNDDDPPYEIPAQGLGVFTCRKDAWLGFNPNFRKFGGEEFYIHEKFRQAGRKVMLLPFLKWWHRFERPDGAGYPNTNWGKLRNYVLGLTELGLSLQPAYDHFVGLGTLGLSLRQHLIEAHSKEPKDLDGKSDAELDAIHHSMKFSEAEWSALLADPVGMTERPGTRSPHPQSKQSLPLRPQPETAATLDALFDWTKAQKRDLDQHLPMLRQLAQQCGHVTGFEKRRESSVALAYAEQYVSYQKEADPLLDELQALKPYALHKGGDSLAVEIEETDLLFIDTVHSAERLAAELERHAAKVRRYIVIRGTGAFGQQAEGSKTPGLFGALRPWLEESTAWFVARHNQAQYGMTVLSKHEADRPEKTIVLWPPDFGPGTEFAALVKELGIEMPAKCSCRALAINMDLIGVEGCRLNRETFIDRIKANQDKWGWSDKLKNFAAAGFKAVLSGLAFRINPLDPIPGLFDEAVRRAEAKAPKESAA